jgi:hypothetical protein
MGKKRQFGLFLFILVLWIQLVFGIGLAFWRFWSIGSGNSEIYIGIGPSIRNDDLIDSAKKHCPDDLQLFYISDLESDGYYVKYQLYPRLVSVLNVSLLPDLTENEILSRVETAIGEEGRGCLMLDGLWLETVIGDDRFEVNERQSVLFFSGRK